MPDEEASRKRQIRTRLNYLCLVHHTSRRFQTLDLCSKRFLISVADVSREFQTTGLYIWLAGKALPAASILNSGRNNEDFSLAHRALSGISRQLPRIQVQMTRELIARETISSRIVLVFADRLFSPIRIESTLQGENGLSEHGR
jgi:hypothetical protein